MSDQDTALTPAPTPTPSDAPGTPATPATPPAGKAGSPGNEDHGGPADIPRNPLATEGVDPKPEGSEEGKADGEADAPAGAPESYEDFTFPEGIVVNEELMEAFLPVAKELNLSQEDAQKLVDLQTANLAGSAQAQEDAWLGLNEEWVNAGKQDPEFGGANYDENVSVALQAIEHFGTPELSDALSTTGAGNHPEIIRFMYRVGKAIAEDKMVTGRSGAEAGQSSLAARLFPSMKNP